jgi:hypothetical protein
MRNQGAACGGANVPKSVLNSRAHRAVPLAARGLAAVLARASPVGRRASGMFTRATPSGRSANAGLGFTFKQRHCDEIGGQDELEAGSTRLAPASGSNRGSWW